VIPVPDLDPPELGNEDPVFLSLLDEARRRTVTEPERRAAS
jgi:hypothetical protein